MRRFLSLLLLASLLLSGTGCLPEPDTHTWSVRDLRLLDPLDAPTPSTELLALYTRISGSNLEIRLDLLDIPLVPNYSLRLRLITPEEEITVLLPADSKPGVVSNTPGLRARLVRNPWLDTIIVRINHDDIPRSFSLQAAAFLPGESAPADETLLVPVDGIPPIERAPVIIAFWDAFPAATPAQALRRWDGAHTGPSGERHGLRHILDSMEEYQVPVALLDLKTPASLAGVNFIGALPQVQRLAEASLLLLPETAFSQPADIALAFSRDASRAYGLPGSQFSYSAEPMVLTGSLAQFISLPDSAHLSRSDSTRLIPLPSEDPPQATVDGPALEVRRRLVQAALSPDRADLVVLGGSLPASTWGDSDMSAATFAWLSGHPWVWVLDRYALMSFPIGADDLPPAPTPSQPDAWLEALHQAPDNAITRSAWQATLMLHKPSTDPELVALRSVYAGQIGSLLTAAAWAEAPQSLADCSGDIDLDGRAECILANEHYFAVLETDGARLSYFFYIDDTGAHQLVAPTSQFAPGISDRSEWQPARGDAADPGAIMGAFSDLPGTYAEYDTAISSGSITLASAGRVKTFHLEESGLQVTYQGLDPMTVLLPLVADPQLFFSRPTHALAFLSPDVWAWGLRGGVQVIIRTEANFSAQGFTASQAFLGGTENPDQEYPAGHYLPFPFSLVTVFGEGDFTIWIEGK